MAHPIHFHLQRNITTRVRPSPRVCQVAGMFGLGIDDQRTVPILPPTDLQLNSGQLTFVTGASGSGKSTLLRAIKSEAARRDDVAVIDFATLLDDAPDRPLVDALDLPLEQTMRVLSLAGLNDAFVMLRRPGELSDGQRYRWRLARALATLMQADQTGRKLHIILADEFAATLDRPTAKVIARNIRKWLNRQGEDLAFCMIVATTHDDLLESLEPDVLVVQSPGGTIAVHQRGDAA